MKRKLILAGIFGFTFMLSFLLLGKMSSADSIVLESSSRNFDSGQAGAWKITKEAKWIGKGKAELTLTADSISTDAGGRRDVVFVVETSASMRNYAWGTLTEAMKASSAEILANSNNTVSLITYDSTAAIVQPMTNRLNVITNAIHSLGLSTSYTTSYYSAITKLEELLDGYQQQSDRKLVVVFVTDGRPNSQTPLEASEYRQFKALYPAAIVNGVVLEHDEDVPELNQISDYQFNMNYENVEDRLSETIKTSENYSTFQVLDTIDTDKFTIDGAESDYGNATVGGGSVGWNMDNIYHSGTKATLTVHLTLKNAYLTGSGNDFYPNKRTTVQSSINGAPSENISSTSSPKLGLRHAISYDTNAPSGCSATVSGSLTPTDAITYDTVAMTKAKINDCGAYSFKGWTIVTDGVTRINDDYYMMPDKDITIRAIWEKIGIDKSTDGTVWTLREAELDEGGNVNIKLKKLAGTNATRYDTRDDNITALKVAAELPADFSVSNDNTISSSSSPLPIYAWYENGTIWMYTPANSISMNMYSETMFYEMRSLVDISPLARWNTENVVRINGMFANDASLSNISPIKDWNTSDVIDLSMLFYGASSLSDISPIAEWDTSSCEHLMGTFARTAITDVDALRTTQRNGYKSWDVSNVTDMVATFWSARSLNDISALSSWNTANVNSIGVNGLACSGRSTCTNGGMFEYASSLSDITALGSWVTSSLRGMTFAFQGTAITNVNSLASWDVSHVTDMAEAFAAGQLSDIGGLSGWNTSSLVYMEDIFRDTNIANASALSGWDTSNVVSMARVFSGAASLADISDIATWNTSNVKMFNEMFKGTAIDDIGEIYTRTRADYKSWDTSKATDFSGMFQDCKNLEDIWAVSTWDTSKVKKTEYMFSGTAITNTRYVSRWNISSLQSIKHMFSKNDALTNVNTLSDWDTSNITDMSYLFYNDNNLTDFMNYGVRNWNTGNVTDMSYMFYSTKINYPTALDGWDVSAVRNFRYMFAYCSTSSDTIVSLNSLSVWQVSSDADTTGMFSGLRTRYGYPSWYDDW